MAHASNSTDRSDGTDRRRIYHGSRWTMLLIIALLVFGMGYLILAISQSGVVPGDDAEPPPVGPLESSGISMDLGALPWSTFVLIATAILGIALAYGQYRASKVTPQQNARTEAATRAMYKDEDRQ